MNVRLKETVLLGVLFLSLAGCATSSGSGFSGDFMTPDQLIGKNITGSNDKEQLLSMKINVDNSLSITEDGNTHSGTWEYDDTKQLLAYVLNWDADGYPQGYMVTITGSGDEVTIMGYWYLTDMNKRFYLSGKMTE